MNWYLKHFITEFYTFFTEQTCEAREEHFFGTKVLDKITQTS